MKKIGLFALILVLLLSATCCAGYAADPLLVRGYLGDFMADSEFVSDIDLNTMLKVTGNISEKGILEYTDASYGKIACVTSGDSVTVTLTRTAAIFDVYRVDEETGEEMPYLPAYRGAAFAYYYDDIDGRTVELSEINLADPDWFIDEYNEGASVTLSEPGSYTVYARRPAIAGNCRLAVTITGAESAKPVIVPTSQKLTVNGASQKTEIYNIDGSNYFKLRDMAMLLRGTDSRFAVSYNAALNAIECVTGGDYIPVGGELAVGTDRSASCVKSSQRIFINGTQFSLTAYNIGGNNFFKLRELGTAFGFGVDYDSATATMLVTTK